MILTLALVEVSSLFVMVCGMLLMTARPVVSNWADLAFILGEAFAISFCCALCFYYNDLYDLRVVRSLGEFIPRLIKSLLAAFLLLATYLVLFPQAHVSGRQFFSSLILIATLLFTVRTAYYVVIGKRVFNQNVLILGTGPLAWKIAGEIQAAPFLRYSILGLLDADGTNGDAPAGQAHHTRFPVYRPTERIDETIESLHPDRIIVALNERRGSLPMWSLLNSSINGTVIEDGVQFYERVTKKLAIENLNPSVLVFSSGFKKPRLQLALRRAVSFGAAAVGIVLTAPLALLIAVAIKLDSKGPVFFVQDREGRKGRIFKLIKFRTMRENPPREDSVWERAIDCRLTCVGRWLRRLHLDELPQFINILRGDMDLIGPRPEMASNVSTMKVQIPYYSLRTAVRPGVTGWAQVRKGYCVTREEVMEKIRYDLYYIKHMSFWFDVRILVDTAKIVVFGWGR